MSDLISLILKEAQSYSSFDLIQNSLTEGKGLEHFPIQPLYMVYRDLPPQEMSKYLPQLSKEQRQAFLDIDLWERDNLDIQDFARWLEVYSLSQDDKVKEEFVTSSCFGLYLKARFNIWTFDVEDPQYPDHDYYFLTEDQLLLFEYTQETEFVEEIQQLIRHLYYSLGVEKAYQHLFKYVSEGYMSLHEEEYHLKKGRLVDYGLVDYFDALTYTAEFKNKLLAQNFIEHKKKQTGKLDTVSKLQSLPASSLVVYDQDSKELREELAKVQDQERREYLQFNFIRLVNGTLTLDNAFKLGKVAMTRSGQKTLSTLKFGLEMARYQREKGDILFDYFDFSDLYKIGRSYYSLLKSDVKHALTTYELESHDEENSFLGCVWNQFIDDLLQEVPKLGQDVETLDITTLLKYQEACEKASCFTSMAPYIAQFKKAWGKLLESGQVMDDFYLNYDLDDIDFESIFLSAFINFIAGNFDRNEKKMGVTIQELSQFIQLFMEEGGWKWSDLSVQSEAFRKKFGMSSVVHFDNYLKNVLDRHLQGYSWKELKENDYRHIGGPILLALH